MTSYSFAWYLAWCVAVVGIVAGVLSGASLTPWHPIWLTPDVAATAGIISAVCVGLAALLPQVGHSPAHRESAYLAASVGVLPDDLAARHPEILTPPMTPVQPPAP